MAGFGTCQFAGSTRFAGEKKFPPILLKPEVFGIRTAWLGRYDPALLKDQPCLGAAYLLSANFNRNGGVKAVASYFPRTGGWGEGIGNKLTGNMSST